MTSSRLLVIDDESLAVAMRRCGPLAERVEASARNRRRLIAGDGL